MRHLIEFPDEAKQTPQMKVVEEMLRGRLKPKTQIIRTPYVGRSYFKKIWYEAFKDK